MAEDAPRSVLIVGCGRSGTSMTAGLFAQAGYSMGRGLFSANEGNQRGIFESRQVNRINEALLEGFAPSPARRTWRDAIPERLVPRYRAWLSAIPPSSEITPARSTDRLARRMSAATSRTPFCLKDPRFCYTLDPWRPHVGDALFLCVFRDPVKTAASLVREAARRPGLRSLGIDRARALEIWSCMYGWVLDRHSNEGSWLFVHADDVLEGSAIRAIEAETGARLDHGFPDPTLQTQPGVMPKPEDVPDTTAALYAELCKRAGRTATSGEDA